MTFSIPKEYTNQEIRVPIQTRSPERIICRAYNPRKANTVYFDAAPVINGSDFFIVRIPKMPEGVYLDVYNEKHGNLKFDGSFRVGAIKSYPIQTRFAVSKILDPNLNRFMAFIDDFAENASILSAQNSIYTSNDGRFRIDYLDVIRDEQGRELTTPFRVGEKSKIIQASKKQIMNYTVPGRRMWLLHEGAHVYINKRPEDELEADKHAITLYLGTGNPIIEAYNVIYKCFKNSPTNLNRQRYEQLNRFIKSFNGTKTK